LGRKEEGVRAKRKVQRGARSESVGGKGKKKHQRETNERIVMVSLGKEKLKSEKKYGLTLQEGRSVDLRIRQRRPIIVGEKVLEEKTRENDRRNCVGGRGSKKNRRDNHHTFWWEPETIGGHTEK